MVESARNDQVSAAFNAVLAELTNARDRLLKDLTAAAGRSDYDAVTELTGRLKRLDFLKEEVGRIQSEWDVISQLAAPDTAQPDLLGASQTHNQTDLDIPDQFELCSPTLQALRTLEGMGKAGRIRDIAETVIRQMQLPDEVTQRLHKDSHQTELEWQLGWARTVLKTCGLVNNPRAGVWALTVSGSRQEWLEPDEIKSLYRQHLARRDQRDRS